MDLDKPEARMVFFVHVLQACDYSCQEFGGIYMVDNQCLMPNPLVIKFWQISPKIGKMLHGCRLTATPPRDSELLRQHGVEAAYAFGSAVKGTRTPDSEMDYFSLMYAPQTLLYTEVNLVAEKTLKNPSLIQSINAHKFPLP